MLWSMKFRLALVLLSVAALSACSGGSSSGSTVCKQQYWDGTVGVCLPETWQVTTQETLTQRGVPEEVLAAFEAKTATAGLQPTITITKETLRSPVDPKTYSQASIRSMGSLPAFKQIDIRKVKVNKEDLEVLIFSAQPLPDQPERRFYQLSTTSKDIGYTLTALTPLSTPGSLESEVLSVLRSVTFTDPTATTTSK